MLTTSTCVWLPQVSEDSLPHRPVTDICCVSPKWFISEKSVHLVSSGVVRSVETRSFKQSRETKNKSGRLQGIVCSNLKLKEKGNSVQNFLDILLSMERGHSWSLGDLNCTRVPVLQATGISNQKITCRYRWQISGACFRGQDFMMHYKEKQECYA